LHCFLAFMSGQWPVTSLYLMRKKPAMTNTQYRLYEMTVPYVAEFCQPRMALKTPQPPPPPREGFAP
jgi:hypothetical protein